MVHKTTAPSLQWEQLVVQQVVQQVVEKVVQTVALVRLALQAHLLPPSAQRQLQQVPRLPQMQVAKIRTKVRQVQRAVPMVARAQGAKVVSLEVVTSPSKRAIS